MSLKTISFILSFAFFILLSIFLSIFFVNFSTKYYVEFKKNEILSYGQLIKNTLENLDISIFERSYIFNVLPSLPEYVYFIIFDDKYNVILYFPYYFEVDLDFLRKNELGKENLITDSKEYLITYFLDAKIQDKTYHLAIEMDLKLIKEFRNSLGKLLIFFLPFYVLFSFIFSFFISNIIQKRLNLIRDFAVKVALGNIRYDSNYPYKDELEDVFKSIRIMKNNLIKLIYEIEEAKKKIEISKEKLQNILGSIPFTVLLIDAENNIKIFNNHYMLDLEEIKQYTTEDIVAIGQKKFKILKIKLEKELLIIFVDFTEVYKIEELRIKFLSEISHDLRTPLTVIKSIISNLKDISNSKENKEELSEKIDKAINYIDKINQMISKYLNYSKIKLRKIGINPIRLSLEEILEMINDTIAFFDCNIEMEFSQRNVENEFLKNKHIELDVKLFQQMIFNLLDNACKNSSKTKIILNFQKEKMQIIVKNEANFEAYKLVKDIFNEIKETKGLGLNIIKEISQINQTPIEISYENNYLLFIVNMRYAPSSF